MESEKKTFVTNLRKLIFCIIVTLLFGRSVGYCQGPDEFEGLSHETERSFAGAQLPEGLTLEILGKLEQPLTSPLAHVEPETLRSVPVPPAGVTAGGFLAAMVVSWLRRRTPSDLPQ